jgi:hypothetical protein
VAALAWTLVAAVWLFERLRDATAIGLAAEDRYAFGDDFIDFWSAPRLALMGRIADVYNFARFHVFQVSVLDGPIHLYHYDYPPIMILLNLPFALLPYLWGLGAWYVGGVLVFGLTVRAAWPQPMPRLSHVALYTVALPAVYDKLMCGQNGTWIAAIMGGGLMALERRPILAGVLLGLLAAKPQMAFLVPVALLCGRRWTALAACAATAALLIIASVLVFGLDPWWAFLRRIDLLRPFILEDGTGFWYIFISIFVTIRHLPAPVAVAYAVQAIVTVIALALVVRAWRSSAPQHAKNAVLVMAAFFATPYVQTYDLVVAMLVPLWLLQTAPVNARQRTLQRLSFAILFVSPMFAFAFAKLTGFGIGCLLLIPALAVAVQACSGGARLRAGSTMRLVPLQPLDETAR